MLKGIHPLISADLLWTLRAMGHGDDLLLTDCNFPAHAIARATVTGRLIQLDGAGVTEAIEAILTLFPLDTYVPEPIVTMAVVDDPNSEPAVHREVHEICKAAHGGEIGMTQLERHAFYAQSKKSFAVVLTGENRPYGNFILKKGVIF